MRHFKLWEIIGLLFILGAWWFAWNSKWDNAYNSYRDFVTSFSYGISQTSAAAGRQFQFALARAVQGTKLNPDDFTSAYIVGWKSAEVRKEWLNFATVRIRNADILIKTVSEFSDKYKLSLSSDLNAIEKIRLDILREVRGSVDFENSDNRVVPIPSENSLSPYQAGSINNRISDLIPSAMDAVNELLNKIIAKRRFFSVIYSIFFVVGSVFVIGAKFAEWLQESVVRKKNKRIC
jgi:hypothetical protein